MKRLTNSKVVNFFALVIIVVGLMFSIVSCAPKPPLLHGACGLGLVWIPGHHLPCGKWIPGHCAPR